MFKFTYRAKVYFAKKRTLSTLLKTRCTVEYTFHVHRKHKLMFFNNEFLPLISP